MLRLRRRLFGFQLSIPFHVWSVEKCPLGSQLSWDSSGAILGCRKMRSVEVGLEWGNIGEFGNAPLGPQLSLESSGARLGCRTMWVPRSWLNH